MVVGAQDAPGGVVSFALAPWPASTVPSGPRVRPRAVAASAEGLRGRRLAGLAGRWPGLMPGLGRGVAGKRDALRGWAGRAAGERPSASFSSSGAHERAWYDVGRSRPGGRARWSEGRLCFQILAYLFLTTLLIIHLHTIQFTPSKRTIPVIFSKFTKKCKHHYHPALELVSHRKCISSAPLQSISATTPSPRQPLMG